MFCDLVLAIRRLIPDFDYRTRKKIIANPFSGKCNSDFTDCDCSDEQVSLKQYTLCAEETICRLDCQRQGMSTGVCKGKEEWDCTCITKNEVEGTLGSSINDVTQIWKLSVPLCHTEIKVLFGPSFRSVVKVRTPSPYLRDVIYDQPLSASYYMQSFIFL